MNEGLQIAVLHDGWRDHCDGNALVFIFSHGDAKVEIIKITGHKTSFGCRDETIEERFDSGEVGRLVVVNAVATDGDADAMRVGFLGIKCCDDTNIGWLFVSGGLGNVDKEHGVGTRWHVGFVPLTEASEIVRHQCNPVEAFTALHHLGVFGKLARVRIECVTVEGIVGPGEHRNWNEWYRIAGESASSLQVLWRAAATA